MQKSKAVILPLENPTPQDRENWRRLWAFLLFDEPLEESSDTTDVAKAS